MAKEILMPQLGESVTEGTIDRWLVKPGDTVKKYDPLAEVTTDKVNAEVPSSYSGTVKELVVEENVTVAVGDLIAYIDSNDDDRSDKGAESSQTEEQQGQKEELSDAESSMKTRYSPAVLMLANEHNIDLKQVKGTGRANRITKKDVEQFVANKPVSNAEPEQAIENETKPSVQSSPPETSVTAGEKVPVTGVRKAIAQNMVKSVQEIPHAWTMVEVDVTNLVRYRNEVKDAWKEKEGYTLTYMPFFMEAVTQSLQSFPQLNSSWENDHIVYKKDINLSVAIAHDEALYVPVIHGADELSLKGLAKNLQQLSQKTKSKRLESRDMQNGTFTINNTGSFGSVQSVPIINRPQAAILSVESIVKRPVVKDDDSIAIRSMVNLCLSIDHRVLDGLIAGRFLQDVKSRLEGFSKKDLS
ncbi:2-oxoisovalerate dehydrogenase E2 component (dihydrolipoyl transacylase) [Geomicrobium sediminis]|uniref:Dihydrolipoamide acetyltransferase component of pyruvate dehydrogenase complex n=2 Tax=Geomicrobium sediminis TaxID=1347788 RepID=A0ABS2PE64_9BACL|nr:dihydrolipoamide acetyltransferase family protein [Geomicrobium sediminis]MBM7633626.1 2-oxoisovalerate dehydrogenase E2 component (dihydrolipoyl transacylase) [Geomicrobium sediminis]